MGTVFQKTRTTLDVPRISQLCRIFSVSYAGMFFVTFQARYCKTRYIRGIKISRFNKIVILAHFNFGLDEIPWLQIVKNDANL